MLESVQRELLFIDWSAVTALFSVFIAKRANDINHKPLLNQRQSRVPPNDSSRGYLKLELKNYGTGVAEIISIEYNILGKIYQGHELNQGLNTAFNAENNRYGRPAGSVATIQPKTLIGGKESELIFELKHNNNEVFDWLLNTAVIIEVKYKCIQGRDYKFIGRI
ncbi:hypothetical protein [uncultured Pseudoteredinibacter sp.]|uniref:hypothetical protein n=1 Tax=uncultured Pseudoteredinibacter sp. TaxID=1641701 RepID=UPI0026108F97|nr:hypothetical protein [uncultured Pseudoteredinibacter sp.]